MIKIERVPIARIAVIHDGKNRLLVNEFAKELSNNGYVITEYHEGVRNFNEFILDLLTSTEGFILLKTSPSPDKESSESELLYRAFNFFSLLNMTNGRSNTLVIPAYTAVPIYDEFNFFPHIHLEEDRLEKAVRKISDRIAVHLAQEAEQHKAVEQKIENNLGDYVNDTLKDLKRRERSYFWIGLSLSLFGLALLIAGAVIAWTGIQKVESQPAMPMPFLIYLGVKNLALLGIVFIACKYAFTLGKSYTNEALKIADRGHAIDFGRFYLRIFGDKITGAEVKDVFQNWNTSTQSHFSTLETTSFDPKAEEKIADIIKTALTTAKESKD